MKKIGNLTIGTLFIDEEGCTILKTQAICSMVMYIEVLTNEGRAGGYGIDCDDDEFEEYENGFAQKILNPIGENKKFEIKEI